MKAGDHAPGHGVCMSLMGAKALVNQSKSDILKQLALMENNQYELTKKIEKVRY